MERRLLLALPLVLGAWAVAGWSLPEGSAKAPDGVKAVFARYDRSINEHDLAGVMVAYAPGNDTILPGTGVGERWPGKEEIRAAYTALSESFDPGTREMRCTWTRSEIKGNLAWMASMCWISDFLKNEKREYGTNLTVILEQLDGKWYFRIVHFSDNSTSEIDSGEES
ncbi:MAG TPA: nuclear transport factor 2 family protein [Candidatus Competibacter sp.]|nr:nuclear transport factor 2 family protein [Candidatus Competibacter sp.]